MKTFSYPFAISITILFLLSSCTRWKEGEKVVERLWCGQAIAFTTLKNNSDIYDSKDVCVQGTVKEPTNLDGIRQVLKGIGFFNELSEYKFYWLEDENGERVFVASENSIPRENRKLTVKATVNETFRYGGTSFLILREKERKLSR